MPQLYIIGGVSTMRRGEKLARAVTSGPLNKTELRMLVNINSSHPLLTRDMRADAAKKLAAEPNKSRIDEEILQQYYDWEFEQKNTLL